MTDAEGHVTKTGYCVDNQVWKVIDAKGDDTVVNLYDANDGSLMEVRGRIKGVRYEWHEDKP